MNTALGSWCDLPTPMGEFRMYDSGDEHVRVVCLGEIEDQGAEPLLRVHSSCLASEVFGAVDCDCADQLREAMKLIATEGRGLVVHLHQEGRGQGLSQKIRAIHRMQQDGLDTVEAFDTLGLEQDTRSYDAVVRLLQHLGISSVRLISNNLRKVRYLQQHGVRVTMVNTHPRIRPENLEYLKTKKAKLGHHLPLEADDHLIGTIRFYHSDQPWGELSNFSPHAIFISGRVWPTVEHFYQAQKFVGTPHEKTIRCCQTPMLVKLRATALAEKHTRRDWPTVKESIMLEALRAKFRQHPDLAERLLSSGDRLLVEHTRNDTYWGDGGDGTGMNRLGHLLMQVRTELRLKSEYEQDSN
ncbi:MAG: GTP cyclohydrolase II RibA [Phycisphaeraceae bacterium]|nr:GTP cyclohydrolase II RibA [Phycisphaeraceae bacterium]